MVFQKLNDGVTIKLPVGVLKLIVCSENIIQVIYSLDENIHLKESLSVIQNEFVNKSWVFEESDEKFLLKTSKLTVEIIKETGSLGFRDDSNKMLFKEPEEDSKILEETNVMGEEVYHIRQNFKWAENEAIYGLGQHQDVNSQINLRGLDVDLFQGNRKAAVPILISSKGYGILWDNYSLTRYWDYKVDSYIWSEVGDCINYYFIYGPEIDQVVKGIRFLTGTCPMFPKWFFGYVQCKERYKTEKELVGIVEEYRKRKIPLDLIIQDWRYWGSILKWGQKSFNKKRFPNPKQMIEEIHDLNAKIMISIWPFMARFTKNYKEMKKNKYLYKGRIIAIYDAFNKEARELYWKQANQGLFKHGIDAWWCDCTEPFTVELADASISRTRFAEKSTNVIKKMVNPKIGSAARYLNAFSLMHSKGMYENQRKVTSEKRVVNLIRSGFTGQQRFSAIVWSGDISARWDVFAAQIPAGLNFCITGIPYWTTDIGAFYTKSSKYLLGMKGDFPKGIEDLGYRELYTRWFQFGAFCPMFRSHGTHTPREVWRFGEAGTVFYDTLVKFINLRYRLLPYIYSVAWMVTNQDYTLMRGLVFDFPHDQKALNINDQFMFGPAFLVCPVLQPMYYNPDSVKIENAEKQRDVYLPEGTIWYDFWTGEKYEGGQTIQAEAPIELMPLYIKAGSVIPIGPEMQYSTEKIANPITLCIYKGADATFNLYEDENDNYNYEKKLYSIIQISWHEKDQKLICGNQGGSFPGMLEERSFEIIFINENKGYNTLKEITPDTLVKYSGIKIELSF
jgi:alpha-D-xyloside xylohydrolase